MFLTKIKMKKYTIFKICYQPPLSSKAIKEITKWVNPGMSSPDGDLDQYSIGFLLAGLEEFNFDPKDIEVLKELKELEIDYIEI